jgi:hypothetical protein
MTQPNPKADSQSPAEALLQYFWPHPYPQSHPPIQVTFSNGMPESDNDPIHKVFVIPYSLLEKAVTAYAATVERNGQAAVGDTTNEVQEDTIYAIFGRYISGKFTAEQCKDMVLELLAAQKQQWVKGAKEAIKAHFNDTHIDKGVDAALDGVIGQPGSSSGAQSSVEIDYGGGNRG